MEGPYRGGPGVTPRKRGYLGSQVTLSGFFAPGLDKPAPGRYLYTMSTWSSKNTKAAIKVALPFILAILGELLEGSF